MFGELAQARRKRRQMVERTRRENVAEMTLELVIGLYEEEYQFQADIPAAANAAQLLRRAIENEARTERFYLDASERIGLGEVARIFQRLARESAGHKAKLESLRSRA